MWATVNYSLILVCLVILLVGWIMYGLKSMISEMVYKVSEGLVFGVPSKPYSEECEGVLERPPASVRDQEEPKDSGSVNNDRSIKTNGVQFLQLVEMRNQTTPLLHVTIEDTERYPAQEPENETLLKQKPGTIIGPVNRNSEENKSVVGGDYIVGQRSVEIDVEEKQEEERSNETDNLLTNPESRIQSRMTTDIQEIDIPETDEISPIEESAGSNTSHPMQVIENGQLSSVF